jgi:dihydropteroate synthase
MSASLEEILCSHRTRQPVVMGILNVTPDSFSDGGEYIRGEVAIAHAREMVEGGVDVIDIGAESTRPGSRRVSAKGQIERLRDVLAPVAKMGVVLSIDTTLAEVARFALDAGATIVNDVSAGRDDPELLPLVAGCQAGLVLMHMLGQPKTMQADPQYDDVVAEVRHFLADRLQAASDAGVLRERCIVDPGIGFGKRLEHNLALLREVGELRTLDCPVLVGPSRKRFIGELTGIDDPRGRLGGTLAACVEAYRGGATVFRVHDVAPLVSALAVARGLESADRGGRR